MPIAYSREQLADSIAFTSIIDPKFKTNVVSTKFITPLNEFSSSANALAAGILGSSNKNFKNLSELTAKLNSLYGTDIGISVRKRGDLQILSISVNAIDNMFTLNNEDILSQILSIYADCLFSPNVSNSGFGEDIFDFRKKDLLDSIDAEINNKRSYAILQAQKHIFEGEPGAFSSYGTKNAADALTPQSVYEAYKQLISTSQIEIYSVSPDEKPQIKNILSQGFLNLNRNPQKYSFNSKSKLKNSVKEIRDTLDVNQTKLVIALKTDCDDFYAVKLMSTILGETPFSKLFANVREKLSLCYYCASGYNESKNTLIIDSGIEKVNIDKARTEILNQLEDIKNGKFSDDEINNSILSILNSLKGTGDTPSSLINRYFSRLCLGDIISPEQEAENIKSVTKDRIVNAARSFALDTVYVMMEDDKNGN